MTPVCEPRTDRRFPGRQARTLPEWLRMKTCFERDAHFRFATALAASLAASAASAARAAAARAAGSEAGSEAGDDVESEAEVASDAELEATAEEEAVEVEVEVEVGSVPSIVEELFVSPPPSPASVAEPSGTPPLLSSTG